MTDFYAILQVASNASAEVIRASYVALSKLHHPDKGGNADTFKAIAGAYEVLKDPQKRAAYDAQRAGRNGGSPGGQERREPWRGHWENGRGWVPADEPQAGFPAAGYGSPQPYPGQIMHPADLIRMAQRAATQAAHSAVDELLWKIFFGGGR